MKTRSRLVARRIEEQKPERREQVKPRKGLKIARAPVRYVQIPICAFNCPKCPGSRCPPPDFPPSVLVATLGLSLDVPLSAVGGVLGMWEVWLFPSRQAVETAVFPTKNGSVDANLKPNSEE